MYGLDVTYRMRRRGGVRLHPTQAALRAPPFHTLHICKGSAAVDVDDEDFLECLSEGAGEPRWPVPLRLRLERFIVILTACGHLERKLAGQKRVKYHSQRPNVCWVTGIGSPRGDCAM